MTVAELRAILDGAPSDLEVVVRAFEESQENGDEMICAGITSARIEQDCEGQNFFAIDAYDEPAVEISIEGVSEEDWLNLGYGKDDEDKDDDS